jgi:hypothetical protein
MPVHAYTPRALLPQLRQQPGAPHRGLNKPRIIKTCVFLLYRFFKIFLFFFCGGTIFHIASRWRASFWHSQPERPLISGETEWPLNEAKRYESICAECYLKP